MRSRKAELTSSTCFVKLLSLGPATVLPLGLLFNPINAVAQNVKIDAPVEMVAEENRDPSQNFSDTVMPALQEVMKNHPRIGLAQQNVCAATYAIMEERTAYYPKLDMSLSGGDKFVDKTTRGDSFGGSNAPEYDGKGLNLSLSLTQQVYDWGQTSASIRGRMLTREASSFEGFQSLQEQLFEFFHSAMLYERETRIVAYYRDVAQLIKDEINALESRFKAGAGRLAEVRAAQVIGLDLETTINSSANRQLIALKNLTSNFEVDGIFARSASDDFVKRRDELPGMVETTDTFEWRNLNAAYRAAGFENKRLKASRLPKLDAIVQAQGWDIDDKNNCGDILDKTHPDAAYSNGEYRRYENCNTYELAGRLEFSMPLYDGGLNKAQRNRNSAHQRAIEAEMAAVDRKHRADSRRIQEQLSDTLMRLQNQIRKENEITQQLASERALQGQSRMEPLTVARLQFALARAVEERLSLEVQLELVRLEALYISDKLSDVIGIQWETNGC